jgi:hypothetical protein
MITIDTDRHGSDSPLCQRVQAQGLSLAFVWTGDRWAHVLEVGDSPRARVAESIESDPLTEDPLRVVSPAYQQLSFQRDPEGVFALLLGQARGHHFSASFRVTEENGGSSVDIDIADRAPGHGAILACTYLVLLPASALADAGPTSIVWHSMAGASGRLKLCANGLAGHPTELALAEAGRRAAQLQALAVPVPDAATQRCRFCWTWSPS